MQLFVHGSRCHLVEVQQGQTVVDLKEIVAAKEGVLADTQYLVYGGRILDDYEDLEQLGLQEGSSVCLLGRLLGGGKKRKKKVYTKPKKIKHKHKNIKLRVLKFYKVDEDGKVQRLRKVCPEPICGPGIFMATHFDRVYCGKCGLTYRYDKSG
eukprot:TRINITY_DN51844_c0_g1_i1.p3 TRINITY_DN51844_c0_g1~~TRINITY_DN51844_c0_g1_i1.p3  ORF type:complete len:153 (-),score=25.75 TRINITY_DN51844_c0_g1_i1:97-555(-)